MKSPDWLRILTASPRQRLPGGVQLRLLTAQEVLEARREATALAGEDRDRALCSNACLVARAVVRRGRPVYGSGEEVLHRLTVGQVETLARAKAMREEDYLWCAVNLLLDEEEVARQLCPQCREAAERARCPVCGRETGEMVREENPTFDWARFQVLKEGACD